jgi:DNA polymerase I-like protein with 3'-5' exonuclease and polymerase domains
MGNMADLKRKMELQNEARLAHTKVKTAPTGVAEMRKRTEVILKEASTTIISGTTGRPLKRAVEAVKNGTELPMGYTLISRNEPKKLEQLKENIIKAKICAFDYETTGDPDDETQDPQDHRITMVSFSYKVGQAFCMPIQMDTYGACWDVDWFVGYFLQPILEHPDVLIIAHNIKFEHEVSLLYDIDMFPKAMLKMVMDTMLMVKALALPESTVLMGDTYEVLVGLKPATKALLADANGMVHNLINVEDIKSFVQTVGTTEWEVATGEFFKSGAKKGLPKTKKYSRSRTFNELVIDQYAIDYSCSDSDWALGLYYKLLPMCIAEGVLDVLQELDVPRMMVLGEYELTGWHINMSRLEDMGKTADEASAVLTPQLSEGLIEVTEGFADMSEDGEIIVPAGIYSMGDWKGDPTSLEIKVSKPFSWGSPQHKLWLFFHVLKVSPSGIKRSKTTGMPTTGKEGIDIILDRYASSGGNSFVTVLKEKLKYDKIKSTYVGELDAETGEYVGGMLQFCRPDTHKLHTNLNLVSTWRLSSKKPNLQNIPRVENDPLGIRGIFEAPTYDMSLDYSTLRSPLTRPSPYIVLNKLSGQTVWVGADYSQIELKVLAWYAKEAGMIHTLSTGGDLHSKVALDVFKLNCTLEQVKELYKPHRYRAKKVNFGLVYGMTEFGLSADPQMGMTEAEARTFIEQYMLTYPGVRGYQHDSIAFAREHGYVDTMFGHRRPIPEINHPNKWIRKKGENKAMNTPIQGSSADMLGLAMVNIRREAPRWLKPVIQIHDELMAEVPVEYASEGARILKEIMERPIDGFSDVMPVIAEPYVGKVWRHALDVSWDTDGIPFVHPKKVHKEATDVTYDDIQYMLPLYKLAGIEVR